MELWERMEFFPIRKPKTIIAYLVYRVFGDIYKRIDFSKFYMSSQLYKQTTILMIYKNKC